MLKIDKCDKQKLVFLQKMKKKKKGPFIKSKCKKKVVYDKYFTIEVEILNLKKKKKKKRSYF